MTTRRFFDTPRRRGIAGDRIRFPEAFGGQLPGLDVLTDQVSRTEFARFSDNARLYLSVPVESV